MKKKTPKRKAKNKLDSGNTKGVKFDGQKPSMISIPKDAMYEMGIAFRYGINKYGDDMNYRHGMKVCRQIDAAIRHLYQFLDGEDLDMDKGKPTSGASHLGHAMASIAMAVYNWKTYPGMDDRFHYDIAKHNLVFKKKKRNNKK